MTTEGNEERPTTEPADELAELRTVVAKARAGDASVLPQLREILDRNPNLVRHYGDLGRHAQAVWVALAGGKNLYMRETFARAAEARRAELTRPGALLVERLLVERVVACDLQLGYLTTAEADALGAGDSYRQLDFQAKRVERAQRMLLSALGALVTYQRLVPAAVAEIAAGEPTRADVGCESHVQPARVAPTQAVDYVLEEEPAETDRDEREPVRVRVPC
jgi:hypothetical protein